MANSMKFGNGQWATKKDSILAYNDENANFKPLPFVTSRASTATRVNKAGLLETVASGVPRVDYLDNSKGSYLIEGNSTNLITESEAFGKSYWTKSGASIEGDASTAGVEQVVNGDNESALATLNGQSFQGYQSTFSQSTTQAYNGTKSMKITSSGSGFSAYVIPNNSAYNSKMYRLDLRVYIPSSLTGDLNIGGKQVTIKDQWVEVFYYFEGENNSTDRFFTISSASGTVGQFIYLDA